MALAVTSSLPILAAIGPGAGQIGSAVAGDDMTGTTPFIAPPSPDPVVVIPIRPGVLDTPPPLVELPAPAGTAAPPRRPVKRTVTHHRHQRPAEAQPDRAWRQVEPKTPRVREGRPRAEAARVVHKHRQWRRSPTASVGHCKHRQVHTAAPHGRRRGR
ncbi:hypothetical protein [Asanoa iriomotensis]|nr:hypothetical protein [Asanoa iriomotensis]